MLGVDPHEIENRGQGLGHRRIGKRDAGSQAGLAPLNLAAKVYGVFHDLNWHLVRMRVNVAFAAYVAGERRVVVAP